MAGRPRLPISTFGAIKTTEVGAGRFRATARFRDWDGQSRQVTATGSSRNAAETALKVELAARMRVGNVGDSANAGSPFRMLAEAWLEDLMLDVDRANGTKTVYENELRGLVLPFFEHFTVREVTVGRIELFLKVQRAISYTRAKHSRTILSMVLGFAVRRGIIARNPVKETSRMKKPQHTPKALTPDQVAAIRLAARDWRTAERQATPAAQRPAHIPRDSPERWPRNHGDHPPRLSPNGGDAARQRTGYAGCGRCTRTHVDVDDKGALRGA
nr:hypothetical protein [Cryobacterium ruanii]